MVKDLSKEDETIVLPKLPVKTLKTNMKHPKQELINQRKEGLERFLNKIVTHIRVRHSETFRKFLSKVFIIEWGEGSGIVPCI